MEAITAAAPLEYNEPRRLMTALGDSEQATHFFLSDPRFIQDLYAQRFVLLREGTRLIGEIDRRAHVCRQIRQVALNGNRFGYSFPMLQPALRGLYPRFAHRSRQDLL